MSKASQRLLRLRGWGTGGVGTHKDHRRYCKDEEDLGLCEQYLRLAPGLEGVFRAGLPLPQVEKRDDRVPDPHRILHLAVQLGSTVLDLVRHIVKRVFDRRQRLCPPGTGTGTSSSRSGSLPGPLLLVPAPQVAHRRGADQVLVLLDPPDHGELAQDVVHHDQVLGLALHPLREAGGRPAQRLAVPLVRAGHLAADEGDLPGKGLVVAALVVRDAEERLELERGLDDGAEHLVDLHIRGLVVGVFLYRGAPLEILEHSLRQCLGVGRVPSVGEGGDDDVFGIVVCVSLLGSKDKRG